MDTYAARASAPAAAGPVRTPPPAPPASDAPTPAPPKRIRVWPFLTVLALLFALLAGAVWATSAFLYRELYSPGAFVERYLSLLADGRAADALAVPGVAVDSAALEDAGLPATASQALLRRAALAQLSDIVIVAESTDAETGITRVTADYRSGGYEGQAVFAVERAGMIGVAPTWRFARSPLAVLDLTVRGSMSFEVNGFAIDKRQVSVDGVDADPADAVPLLVFSPGVYSVAVDTPISESPGVVVVSDSPFTNVPVTVQTKPTEEFIGVVQDRVDEFLDNCATQEVLQPTACPFGLVLQDRVVSTPDWSIAEYPPVEVVPDGAGWRIPDTDAVAHLDVDVQSLFDGSIYPVSEDVPFIVTARISVLPDGTASIVVSGPDTR